MNMASRLFFVKVFFTGLIVYFLGKKLDFQLVKQTLKQLSYPTVLAGIGCLWVGISAGAKRWQEIISCQTKTLPLLDLWRQTVIGAFLNQCLPSSVGGDVYRGFMAKQYGLTTEWAINSTLIDRLYGLMGFVLLGILALPGQFDTLNQTSLGQTMIVCLLLAGAGFTTLAFFHRLPLPKVSVLTFLETFSKQFYLTLKNRDHTGKILACSWITTLGCTFPLYLISLDMNLSLTFGQIVIALPFIFLIAVVPISFAGWGLREGTMVVALGLFGIGKEQAFSLSVVYGLIQLLAALPGLIVWLAFPHSPSEGKSA
ncbi:lysylphosphatidylglycerol synthase transmembrane domain-containing protein [Candidatus Finniella inopinata]|uniref:Flippase-like domain-containing protein n=1 Tax=Candidatus Finniella inopinata TaxID=1696036 RepID=A0A4Q7DKQ5_9PROT|nr:lysylphosphatidylglycerol synthase transmembrane domain-containing protein [Candidatus Finniella inopinata]RZI46909.1 flippase-like domain-containing protein [Candidatus Finniella inopinata]